MEQPALQDFADVSVWIFDLDNTLYPAEARLFDQVSARMTEWIMLTLRVDAAEAGRLRRHYWHEYGTTLAGLMRDHAIDPHDFLAHVHDIDLTALRPDQRLAQAIRALPGRKIIHTNADTDYAARVLAARGLDGFDAIWGIGETGWHPKPDERAYAMIRETMGFESQQAAMFEDAPRNLEVPFAQGMRTVLVGTGHDGPADIAMPDTAGGHITHRTLDLTAFLTRLAPVPAAMPV